MRIGFLVHDADNGTGQGRYVRSLADVLDVRHQVTVFANQCVGSPPRWRHEHVRAWRRYDVATVATFACGIRHFERSLSSFDIVHAQGYCGGEPNVVTAHICVDAYLAALPHASQAMRLSRGAIAVLEKRFYRRYAGPIIAVSKKVAEELCGYYRVPGAIHVIPHAVDVTQFNPEVRRDLRRKARGELGVSDDELVVLYVGELEKSHHKIAELVRALPRVTFAILTRTRTRRLEAQNIRHVPPTPRLECYYAAADAFIFPTTYDSFGMVVLEAMACGLPVFCSDQAGAAELITHGVDGFRFSLADWVAGVESALAERQCLGLVGDAAARTASRHSWPEVVTRTEEIYRGVLK